MNIILQAVLMPLESGTITGIVVVLVLLFLSAMVSGSEVAFFSLTPGQISELKEHQSRKSERALMHLEARIVDDHMSVVPTGDVGELVIRGPNLLQGYWNRPEATEEATMSDSRSAAFSVPSPLCAASASVVSAAVVTAFRASEP